MTTAPVHARVHALLLDQACEMIANARTISDPVIKSQVLSEAIESLRELVEEINPARKRVWR